MIKLTGVREMEAKLRLAANSPDVRQAMASAGAKVLAAMATEAFRRDDARPAPWPPLKASTLARVGAAAAKTKKRKAAKAKAASDAISGRKPLYDTGALSQSIRPVSTAGTFGVASDRPYAKYHQYGTKNIPARPFVPALGAPGQEKLTPQAEKDVGAAMAAAFEAAVRRLGL